jgi:D-alanine transaminase
MSDNNQIVYLNGEYLPLDQARVSVLDRGFLFGDGVYEVIPVYGGRPLRLEEHLTRLENSLAGIRMQPPLAWDQWKAILDKLIVGTEDQSVYLQVTRGAAPKRDHAFPETPVPPTIFAMRNSIAPIPASGASAITVDDIRWKWCHIKAITLLGNILMRQIAVDEGCAEAILIKDGYAIEGAASNLFVVLNGVIITPPKTNDILPGITRDIAVEIARENAIALEERAISVDELKRAEEVWVSSATREILPIVQLDGKPVGNGKPGAVWDRMNALYQQHKALLRKAPAS